MSLINQMLNDLESRQAFIEEKSDSVLDGLQHSDIYEYEEDNRRPLLLFMVLSIILITVIVYAISGISSPGDFNMERTGKIFSGDSTQAVNPESKQFANRIIPGKVNDVTESDVMNSELKAGVGESRVLIARPVTGSETVAGTPNKVSTDGSTSVTGVKINEQGMLHPLSILTLSEDIAVSGNSGVVETQVTESGDDLQSLSLASSVNGIDIDLVFSLIPDYSVFTLADPARLVIELNDFEPVDTDRFQDSLPDSVTLRSRHDEAENFQLIFEFPEPVSLQDTVLKERDRAASLHIALMHLSSVDSGDTIAQEMTSESEFILPSLSQETADRPVLEKKVHKEDLVRRSDDLYRDGLLAYREHDAITAIDKLYTAVSSNAKNHRARVVLAELLLEQGDKKAARKLLVDGLALQPDHSQMAKLLAQLLAEEQNNQMALYYLQKAMPDVRKDTEYHALVAALLQREKRHQEAIAYYLNVLGVNAENGLWWMGLGISLEATGANHRALSAYRRARQDSSLTNNVAKYLDSRISQLNG